ncbi:MAG: hypothetical protein H6619_02490 [Deltaproteobacteria bacterium]|nr:hypothetical protein [Deltaproteobacteria bacterium]
MAQESYLNNDLQLAYGSAHAVMKLTKEESYLKLAKHVLARCYLGSGAEKRAIPLFEELLAKDPSNTFMKEDLAAAYYACEEPAKCREILESIEYDKLTQAGKSVLLSLQRQEGEGQTFH